MPYVRKDRCVYKKDTNKKIGCSTSIAKAKKYIIALHANVEDEEKKVTFTETYNQIIQQYGN